MLSAYKTFRDGSKHKNVDHKGFFVTKSVAKNWFCALDIVNMVSYDNFTPGTLQFFPLRQRCPVLKVLKKFSSHSCRKNLYT